MQICKLKEKSKIMGDAKQIVILHYLLPPGAKIRG